MASIYQRRVYEFVPRSELWKTQHENTKKTNRRK